VSDAELSAVAPATDALALRTESVPLVVMPMSRRRSKSKSVLSTVEHEIVHVNQMLVGHLYTTERRAGLTGAIENFFEEVRCEVQANFMQLATWPEVFPRHIDLTLEAGVASEAGPQRSRRRWPAALAGPAL
jgi:hypothetical protein